MPAAAVLYIRKDHIAYITLNRPEADNVINRELARELEDICCQVNQDDEVYVVIIAGAGDGAFCAGSEFGRGEYTPGVATAVAGIDCPVIAAISGDALGQGLELALACDLRLAAEKAHFGFPQVARGLIPQDGGTQRLSRIVGRGKALEMILTTETISAAEAFDIGLVSQVIADEKLAQEAETLAGTMAARAPVALRFAKEAVNKGLDLTLEQGLRLEADLYFLLHTTVDRTEGITAFLKKRPPQFKGR